MSIIIYFTSYACHPSQSQQGRVLEVINDLLYLLLDLINAIDIIPGYEVRAASVNEHLGRHTQGGNTGQGLLVGVEKFNQGCSAVITAIKNSN